MNGVIKSVTANHSTLTDEDLSAVKTMTELWYKPEEYFDNTVNSGMCGNIIGGYILLVLDKLELTPNQKHNVNKFIYSVLEDYDAQQARERYADRIDFEYIEEEKNGKYKQTVYS